MKNSPLVSIICTAYNHEAYIKAALDGFVMQKTTFPFEIIVHDDASTDRTVDIVRAYEAKHPDLFANIYQTENQYSKGHGDVGRIVFGAARGKYIALCEGDDYWTDPLKIQRQVEFLEANPDYGMTYSKVRFFVQRQDKILSSFGGSKENFEELLLGNTIPSLTVCFRTELLNGYIQEIEPETKNWLMGDYPMWLYFSHVSKIRFQEAVTGVYRVLEESASHSSSVDRILEFQRRSFDVSAFFAEKYCDRNNSVHQTLEIHHTWLLFRNWTRYNMPTIKKTVEKRIVRIEQNATLKKLLMKVTLKLTILRLLFVYYDKLRSSNND